MIEARRIISTVAGRLPQRLWQTGKGASPKEVEAKGFPGQTRNTCLTVAIAECYHQKEPFSACAQWKYVCLLVADACIGLFF